MVCIIIDLVLLLRMSGTDSGTEPSLVSVRELPDTTQLTTIELDVPEEDTQQLLSEEEQATEENDGDQPIQKEWRIQSKLHQRKAKW